jgi:DNA-binding GntR family transcriptional regulator
VRAPDLVVRHQSIADQVAHRIRRLILSRQLQPGQRVKQAELAKMMGVSTMPVREALLRLVSEGMVVADVNRAFTIAATTKPQGIRDIYWLHAAMAGELAARAWDKRTDELVIGLRSLHADYLGALGSGLQAELFQTNWSFHSSIHRTAASPAIRLTLKNTLSYLPDFTYEVPGWNQLAAEWQAQLIEQFTDGDREGARAVVSDCCDRSAEIYIAAFFDEEG